MKRFLSLSFVLLFSFSLMACMGSDSGSVEIEPVAEEDLGPLTIQDCQEIGELVDADTGYSCLIGVAIESDDVSVCDRIPEDNAQNAECKTAMGM
ncbi:MAG: hypothetical protein P1V18_05830 [Candidatus Gracilibacteria bacterium]|nr:hypothetical protein [Candidatus Gracilibacteria bacterium]